MTKTRRAILQHISALAVLPAIPTGSHILIQKAAATSYTRSRRTSPLPVVSKTPDSLAVEKLVLPFSKSNARSARPLPVYQRGSYKSLGLTPYMGATGERQEIGLVTDAQGAWLCGGSPNNMLVQAESHADVPVHFGKVDLRVTPWAQCYEDNPAKGSPYFDIKGYEIMPEVAHYPSLNYVPYLATGDLFYLEELQAEATFMLIAGPGVPEYRPLIDGGQPRGLAWTVRAIASAYLATQEAEKAGALPSHLLPSSYWKGRLDIYRKTLTAKYLNSKDPRIQAFRCMVIDFGYWIAPWEQDFLGAVLGWMVWSGRLDEWRPIYEWSIKQALDRATFGDKAIGYHWTIGKATDYTSLIAANQTVGDASYKAYYRANLKVATLNKVAGAEKAFAVADGMARGFAPWKWAV